MAGRLRLSLPPLRALLAAGALAAVALSFATPADAKDYRRNGRCDDERYETSNGGKAAPGTDEYDCSRYGDGMKDEYARQRARASRDNDKDLQHNNTCDDPRYATTTGRAARGADEFDCSRYGGGMSGRSADRAGRRADDDRRRRDDRDRGWDDRNYGNRSRYEDSREREYREFKQWQAQREQQERLERQRRTGVDLDWWQR